MGFSHFIIMKPKTIDFLYRSFLVDFLTQKSIISVNGRNVKSQKVKYLEREYKKLYFSNPKNDFLPLKDKYNDPENFYVNIYAKNIGEVKGKKPSVFDKYLDPNWKKKRTQVFTRDKRTCKVCKSNKNLQCHHQYYINGRKLWEYPLDCFLTLCRTCHEEYHEKVKGSTLVIRDPFSLKDKLAHEKKLGFSLVRNNPKKAVKTPIKAKTKPIIKLQITEKEETIEQRRKRLVVPQWKIDQYRKNLAKQTI